MSVTTTKDPARKQGQQKDEAVKGTKEKLASLTTDQRVALTKLCDLLLLG